jgi:PPOX class probable F420-dependent enzyme
MTREEIDAFLAETHLCHFATVDSEGLPRVRPLWYLWKDGEFWLTTRTEARFTGRDLASSPRVALSIGSEYRPYRGVVVHGKPEVFPKDLETLIAISMRYGDERASPWTAEAMAQNDRVLMRLVPEKLFSWDYARD